jgi:hypothetical protein
MIIYNINTYCLENEKNVELEKNAALKTPSNKLVEVPLTHLMSTTKGIQTPVLKNSTNKLASSALSSRLKEVDLNR